jgi:aminomuconate-semialdehyde/2-hydroxymuconate-6-semialdehyde dehydrogenase
MTAETEFFGHVIDGEEVESRDGQRFDTVDPWTRKPWAQNALGATADADRGIAAARTAFDAWLRRVATGR